MGMFVGMGVGMFENDVPPGEKVGMAVIMEGREEGCTLG